MQTSTSFEGGKILHDFVNCSALISLFPSKNNERKDSSNSQLLIWSRFAAEGARRGSRRIQSLEAATLWPCSAGGFSRNLPATTVFFSHTKSASYSAKQYFPLTRNQPASQPASQPNKAKVLGHRVT